MPALTTLPVVINPGDPNHIEHHEDLHALYNGLTIADGLSNRPVAGNEGAYYIASWAGTTITRLYRDNGTDWVSVLDPFGVFNPLDYGADPTGATDSKAAFEAAIAAAQSDLMTGLPYEAGTVQGAIVEVTAGQYKISSSIFFPGGKELILRGVGGQATRQLAVPVIVFTTGGFIIQDGQAYGFEFDHLEIIGITAPAITATSATITTKCGTIIRNCLLRSTGTGVPALKLSNVFDCNAYNSTFRSPDSSTPSILIESGSVFGFGVQGWMFRFHECLFEENGIRWDCSGLNSTVPGIGCGIYDCITENFDANTALLHVRNTHATDAFTWYGIEILNTDHYDSADPVDLVKLETLGSGTLFTGAIHIRKCGIAGAGQYVRAVKTGTGEVRPDFILIEGRQQITNHMTWAGAGGGSGAMSHGSGSGWFYESAPVSTVGVALATSVNGEAQKRFTLDAKGFMRWSLDGAAAPSIVHGVFNGTPEANVTSSPAGFVVDGSTGIAYIKVTGVGNTGWKPVAGVSNNMLMQNSAGSSFIDWSRVQVVFIGNGGAVTMTLKQGASQTVSIQEWTNNAGSTILSRINKDGYFMTRKTAAPADGDLATSEMAIWLDDTAGAANLKIKAKDSGGTVRTGTVALA